MTQLNSIEIHSRISLPDAPARSSRFEELFLKDDFLRIVLIGFAGGFGLSTLVILLSLELTTLRGPMAEQLGAWWFVIPLSTVIGFTFWTVMILRIRRDRIRGMLRSAASSRQVDPSCDPEAPQLTDLGHVDPNEDWL